MSDKDVFVLAEIIDYCDKITAAVNRHNGSREDFESDLDFQEACAFRAIQIGELVNSLSDVFKDTHPEIQWNDIVAFRNIVTHDYGRIDTDKMWETVVTDIPALRDFCAQNI